MGRTGYRQSDARKRTTRTPMPTRMSTTARMRFMLPFCFPDGTEVAVAAVSGAAVTLVSVAAEPVVETVVSVVLVDAGGGAVAVVVVGAVACGAETIGGRTGSVDVSATFTGGGAAGFGFGNGVALIAVVAGEVAFAIFAAGFGAVVFGAGGFAAVFFGAFGDGGFAVTCAGFFTGGGAATVRRGDGSGCAPRATRSGVETPRRVSRCADSRARKRRVSGAG